MPQNVKTKEKLQPNPVPEMLNHLLADAIDLHLSAKQAHWNVRGRRFISLHELFDKISEEAQNCADLLAERAAQLDVVAQGTLQAIATRSCLPAYPHDIHDEDEHIRSIALCLRIMAESCRQSISEAATVSDAVTIDILTEINRNMEKLHWLVRSHLD